MYSLAAQCICMKIQILREPGRNFMRDLFQTINIFQVVVVPQDLNHSNADVITQLIVFQKMAMKLFFNMTTKKGKTPITLTYTKTIGISLSAEVQASFSVSNTKTSSISHRFWWIFFQHFTVTQTS